MRVWVYIDTKTSGNCVCVVVKPSMTALEMTQKVLTENSMTSDEAAGFILHEVVHGGSLQRPIHYKELVLDVTLKWGTWCEQDRRDNYLLLKKNILYEEALLYATPTLEPVFTEAAYGDLKMRSFKKQQLTLKNLKLTVYKSEDSEVGSWPIEEITWYLGAEPKRHPPHSLNISFIQRGEAVQRNRDRVHFGHTISFESHESYVKWIAAMMVAEHSCDLRPAEKLLDILI